jgi:hypothetical protein
MATARDVIQGSCSPVGGLHNGLPAGPGPDEATGSGLLDAFSSVVAGYYLSLVMTEQAPAEPASTVLSTYV